MSNAKPQTPDQKRAKYPHPTLRQKRQIRRAENHLLAFERKQEQLKKRKRSEAAKRGATTRALKKRLRKQGVEGI